MFTPKFTTCRSVLWFVMQSGPAASAPAESATTGYLWFPEETELWLLRAALQLLRPIIPLPFSKPSSQSAGLSFPQLLFELLNLM